MQLSLAACLALALATVPTVSADASEATAPHKKLRHHKKHRHHHGRAHAEVNTAAASQVAPSDPQSQPQMPAAANTGPNGYPQLPAVSAMLGSASQTMQSINAEARVLEARVVQTQMENEAKMARQKAVFEQKLKSQEDRSRAVVAANQRISGEIASIQGNISALQHKAEDIQRASEIMRSEMKTLGGRLARGKAFLLSALKSLDDGQAPELAILQELKSTHRSDSKHERKRAKTVHRGAAPEIKHHKKKQAHEVLMKIASDDKNDKDPDEVSFLALEATHAQQRAAGSAAPGAGAAAGSPKDLVNTLGQAVTTLQQEEHLSEAKLKVMFLTNFKAGVKRYAALLADQRKLIATRKTLLAQQAELSVADEHLRATQSALQQKLQSFGLFAQKLAHLALAPTEEARELLRHLPADVDSSSQEPHFHA